MKGTNFFNSTLFKDKHILITGASSGIGLATATMLTQLGATVHLIARSKEKLQYAQSNLIGGHTIHPFDLTRTDEIVDLVKGIASSHGPIEGLFHCAGLELIKPLSIIKPADINTHFKTSVDSFLMLTKAMVSKQVRKDNPVSIVAMSSVAGSRGQSGMSVYSGVRGAIDATVRSLAVEYSKNNVRVNSIVSGAIETPMHCRITELLPMESIETYKNRHLLGFGQAENIANTVIFLLSDASQWITGTQLVVDGGYLCH